MEEIVDVVTEHLSGNEKLANAQVILGRLAAGEIVSLSEVSPRTHGMEIITIVSQSNRSRANGL